MYFWRIEKLKEELRQGQLGQRAAFGYVLIALLASMLPPSAASLWIEPSDSSTYGDLLKYGAAMLLAIGGTYIAYRANGGPTGTDFAARYLAVSWVVSIRITILFALAVVLVVCGAWTALVAIQGVGHPHTSSWFRP